MRTTKTRVELIAEAADKLQIVGTGQTLEAEYSSKIDGNIDPLFNQLAKDGICHVASDDDIPAEWFDSLAGLLANINAPIAGATYDPKIKLFYEVQLRRLTSTGPSYGTLPMEFF